METKSMLISLEDAKKFYPDGSPEFKAMCETTFPETFKRDIRDRVKTFQDALDIYLQTNTLDSMELDLLNYQGSNSEIINDQAFKKLKIIVKVTNQGWAPDWANTSQYKWFPWFYMSPFAFDVAYYESTDTSSYGASRLCVHSEELAIYLGETFADIYKVYYSA